MLGILKGVVVGIGTFLYTLGTMAFPVVPKSAPAKIEVQSSIISPVPTSNPNLIRAVGTYSQDGYAVSFTLQFPKTGGKVTGNINGICSGSITDGLYNASTGELNADASGTCVVISVTAKLSATFRNGMGKGTVEVDENGKTATGDITFSTSN